MRDSINENELIIALNKHTEEVRKLNEDKFAIKLVEKIVFGLVTLLLTAVVAALISLILIK